MPPPLAYTESKYQAYLHQELGEVATRLGWSVGVGSYNEIVSEIELALGITDVVSQDTPDLVRKLRAFGRLVAWKQAIKGLAAKFEFTADLQGFKRNQMQDMALKALALAESDCAELGIGGTTIVVEPLVYIHDPNEYFPDAARVR